MNDPFHPGEIAVQTLAGERGRAVLIELATRRRLRLDGRVDRLDDGALRVAVHRAFPNCPKYIGRRDDPIPDDRHAAPAVVASGRAADGLPAELVERAEAPFLARSAGPGGALDVNHRGGPPGFTVVVDGGSDPDGLTGGTGRWLDIETRRWRRFAPNPALVLGEATPSPFNPSPGRP